MKHCCRNTLVCKTLPATIRSSVLYRGGLQVLYMRHQPAVKEPFDLWAGNRTACLTECLSAGFDLFCPFIAAFVSNNFLVAYAYAGHPRVSVRAVQRRRSLPCKAGF